MRKNGGEERGEKDRKVGRKQKDSLMKRCKEEVELERKVSLEKKTAVRKKMMNEGLNERT